MLKPLTL